MLKAELKEKWGMYCDTDILVDNMMALLTKYHHNNTENGVCTILDTYFTNKQSLIDLFAKSERYIGNMRICLNVEMERMNNAREVRNFCECFADTVGAREVICTKRDAYGKTLEDYLRTGIKKLKARDLHYGNLATQLRGNEERRKQFRHDGFTRESWDQYAQFVGGTMAFKHSTEPTLCDQTITELKANGITTSFVTGMKTSRAFNRLCTNFHVDKASAYNKMFAQYADMVSGLKRKMKFYISLNPLDYLTMSFGNSWSSCQTIDKKNERNMPNSYSGMHCGGTLSYMLDGTSIITYAHMNATEDHEEGKIYRNMFHYYDGLLAQGRVYPQGNDGATDLYKTFRRFVQTEMSKLLEVSDDWVKRSASPIENIYSYGVHYRDYEHFDGCNLTYPKAMSYAVDTMIDVGHERICPICGKTVKNNEDCGYLTHEACDNEFNKN